MIWGLVGWLIVWLVHFPEILGTLLQLNVEILRKLEYFVILFDWSTVNVMAVSPWPEMQYSSSKCTFCLGLVIFVVYTISLIIDTGNACIGLTFFLLDFDLQSVMNHQREWKLIAPPFKFHESTWVILSLVHKDTVCNILQMKLEI